MTNKSKINSSFMKLKSIEDLARLRCSFNGLIKTIYTIKLKNKNRLLVFGEKINEIRNIYYYDVNKISDFGIYSIEKNKEKFEFSNKLTNNFEEHKKSKFLIIEIENKFKEIKSKKQYKVINVKNYKAMIKKFMLKSLETELIQKVYVFNYKKNNVIGSFNLFNNEEIFAYSIIDNLNENLCFFKYDFSEDSLKTTNYINDISINIGYVKIINLSKPFDFFKPE